MTGIPLTWSCAVAITLIFLLFTKFGTAQLTSSSQFTTFDRMNSFDSMAANTQIGSSRTVLLDARGDTFAVPVSILQRSETIFEWEKATNASIHGGAFVIDEDIKVVHRLLDVLNNPVSLRYAHLSYILQPKIFMIEDEFDVINMKAFYDIHRLFLLIETLKIDKTARDNAINAEAVEHAQTIRNIHRNSNAFKYKFTSFSSGYEAALTNAVYFDLSRRHGNIIFLKKHFIQFVNSVTWKLAQLCGTDRAAIVIENGQIFIQVGPSLPKFQFFTDNDRFD